MSSHASDPCVLVTSAGTGTAFGLIRAMRSHWGDGLRIVAGDIHPAQLVTASLFADVFVRLPPFAQPAYPAALADVLAAERVDHLIAVSDPEICLAATLPAVASNRVSTPFHGAQARHFSNDKWAIYEACRDAGLPVPETRLADREIDAGNCVVKQRSGFGSRGVRVMPPGMSGRAGAGELIQDLLWAPEVTIDAHRDETGRIWSACRERIETRLGVSSKCRIFQNDALHGLAVALLDTFDLATLCFQVMHDGQGRPRITDVNFRTGAGTSMSTCAGFDFHAALAGALLGESTSRHFQTFRPVVVTRQYSDFVMADDIGT